MGSRSSSSSSSSSKVHHEEKEVIMIKDPLLIKNIDSSSSSSPSSKGGLKTLTFILGSVTLKTMGMVGIVPNMPLYLINEYHMDVTTSSAILFYWAAATDFIPVIAAVVADSYVGRLNMMAFGSLVSVLGLGVLWSTTMIPGARPPPVPEFPATAPQLFLLCMSFVVMAVGAGCFKACSAAFGVDQLAPAAPAVGSKKKGGKGMLLLEKYFNWYMASLEIGVLIAYTCIVYVQDRLGWSLGFGVCVVVMVFSCVFLFLGIPFYVNIKTKGNLIVELAQVIVASFHKRHAKYSDDGGGDMFFHNNNKIKGSSPTENLRFLNKACVIEDGEHELTTQEEGTKAKNPWRLCTVEQVENLKSLVKIIPIWSTGVILFATMNYGSFTILQAKSMNREIRITPISSSKKFEIPAGSLHTISILSVITWILFYRQLVSRFHLHFTTKQRMGAGLLVSSIYITLSAVVERFRRRLTTTTMSVLWVVPQLVLLGIVEALNGIAQLEFYISELPRSMSSMGSCMLLLGGSVGNLLANLLMSTVDSLSTRSINGGGGGWISTDINKGHYDYYFWFVLVLSIINFFYFLLCCKIYGPCINEKKVVEEHDDEENVLY